MQEGRCSLSYAWSVQQAFLSRAAGVGFFRVHSALGVQFLSSLPCAALSKLKHFQLGRLAGGNEEEGFHLVRLVVFALRMWSVGRSVGRSVS